MYVASRLKWKIFTGYNTPKFIFMVIAFAASLFILTSHLRVSPEMLSKEMLRQKAETILARYHNRTAARKKIPRLPDIDHFFFKDGERVNDSTTQYVISESEPTQGYDEGDDASMYTGQPTGTTGYTLVYDESTIHGYRGDGGVDAGTFDDYTTPESTSEPDQFTNREEEQSAIEEIIKGAKLKQPHVKKDHVPIFRPAGEAKAELEQEIEKIYKKRKDNLREFCGPRKGWAWLDSMQTIAAPEKNLVVCVIQKAGSSSWHHFVYNLRFPGKKVVPSHRGMNWKYTKNLSKSKKTKLMRSKSVIRVITVRHPFARIVSGWNNKFRSNFVEKNGNIMAHSMPGIQKYIGRHTPEKDHEIAFQDLVQYIADAGLEKVDVHFRSMEHLCSPCLFPYDYIIKAETAPEYSWYVTDKVNGTMHSFARHTYNVDDPHPASEKNYHATGEFLADAKIRQAEEANMIAGLFRTVPRATIRVLKDLFADDFKAFGYTFDVSTLEVGGYS